MIKFIVNGCNAVTTFIMQLLCAIVFGHKYDLDPDGKYLSDRKCTTCGKKNYFWNIGRKIK